MTRLVHNAEEYRDSSLQAREPGGNVRQPLWINCCIWIVCIIVGRGQVLNYCNVPWAGVRASVLRDVLHAPVYARSHARMPTHSCACARTCTCVYAAMH